MLGLGFGFFKGSFKGYLEGGLGFRAQGLELGVAAPI